MAAGESENSDTENEEKRESPVALQRMAHEVQFPGFLKGRCHGRRACAAIIMRLESGNESSHTVHLIRFLTARRSFAMESLQPIHLYLRI